MWSPSAPVWAKAQLNKDCILVLFEFLLLKLLQMPHTKDKIMHALKSALQISCWMFCRIAGCSNPRDTCQHPGYGKSTFQLFLNIRTAKISVSRRPSRTDSPSHYLSSLSNPSSKDTLGIQGKISLSSLKSVKNVQKRQGINVWGWNGQGEGKSLGIRFRDFPWAMDNSSRSLQCLERPPSIAKHNRFEDLNTGEKSVLPCTSWH